MVRIENLQEDPFKCEYLHHCFAIAVIIELKIR